MTDPRGSSFVDRRTSALNVSPTDLLEKMPARTLMERLSIPLVAVNDDGDLVTANAAFAELLGCALTDFGVMTCGDIFHDTVVGRGMLSSIDAHAEQVVTLRHHDGHTVYAKMTRSVLLRQDETIALVAFTDVTELRWLDGGTR